MTDSHKIREIMSSLEITEDDNVVRRLEEILDEFKVLIFEASTIVRKSGNERAHARAKAYWIGHITTALDSDHSYLGSSMTTMQDTINELSDREENSEEY